MKLLQKLFSCRVPGAITGAVLLALAMLAGCASTETSGPPSASSPDAAAAVPATAKSAAAPRPGQEVQACFKEVAERFAAEITNPPMAVAIFDFGYGETRLTSYFTELIHAQFSRALIDTRKFKVKAWRYLPELKAIVAMNKTYVLNNAGELEVRVGSVQAFLRGSFIYYDKTRQIGVNAELIATHELDMVNAGEFAVPQGDLAEIHIVPPGAQASQVINDNVNKQTDALVRVAQTDAAPDARPFKVKLQVAPRPNRHPHVYAVGERIDFSFWANQDCHAALVCHEQGGHSVLLVDDIALPKNTVVKSPGPNDEWHWEISDPPGADTYQLMAFADKQLLDQAIKNRKLEPVTVRVDGTRGPGAGRGQPVGVVPTVELFKGMTNAVATRGAAWLVYPPAEDRKYLVAMDKLLITVQPKP